VLPQGTAARSGEADVQDEVPDSQVEYPAAGDAFYIPPGHVPVKNEPGTEFLWFSPSEELRTAEAVMIKNMQPVQDGSTP
jgi:hypothetical protein